MIATSIASAEQLSNIKQLKGRRTATREKSVCKAVKLCSATKNEDQNRSEQGRF